MTKTDAIATVNDPTTVAADSAMLTVIRDSDWHIALWTLFLIDNL